jgi:putative ABC transport system permease protein
VLRLALSTFRDRWYLFLGAVLSVAAGVALMDSSLVMVASAHAVPVPVGTPRLAAVQLRAAYDDVATLMIITSMISTFLTVSIVSTTFAFTVDQRRRDLALLRLVGGSRGQVRRLLLAEALLLAACGVTVGVFLAAPLVRAPSPVSPRPPHAPSAPPWSPSRGSWPRSPPPERSWSPASPASWWRSP